MFNPGNIASTLTITAERLPNQTAIALSAEPGGQLSFQELDRLSDRLARGLVKRGVTPGTRIVLMVRPGIEFIALTYALFRAGAVVVLIDPGMGPKNVFACLDQIEPQGFVAIPIVQAMRVANAWRFRAARHNVTLGTRWFWGGATYNELMQDDTAAHVALPDATRSTDPAAIIFTSGSTGPAKGVLYEHGMFAAQVEALRDFYHIEPGGVDLPGFPLFALFNAAMGVTTVVPDMDPTRPAQVDPERIVAAVQRFHVTQGFGSPAIWERVGRYCVANHITLPTVRRVFSAGAPVPIDLLQTMRQVLIGDDALVLTPYGATEALPICSIASQEVLSRTAAKTRQGAGTCVGRPFPVVRLKIIDIIDEPIESMREARELPAGQIGEIIVQGPMVTRAYFRQPKATALAKIVDEDQFWHRMGDVGYLDDEGVLWYCGRKGHRVETPQGRLFTDCVEPIFSAHLGGERCALVGVGRPPNQVPILVLEQVEKGVIHQINDLHRIAESHETTRPITQFLFFPESLPVDVRHNIKINREELAVWAAQQLKL
ncbi:MAG: fatty acid CoA ligase family protein [Planctomycetales bacterium]